MKINKLLISLRITLLLSLVSLLIASCGLLYLYRELHELPGMQWSKSSVQSFEVRLDNSKEVDASILFRHVDGYRYENVKMKILAKHDGTTWLDTLLIVPIKNESGDYLGEGAVDIWDVDFPFLTKEKLDAGQHTFEISHTMNTDPLPLVMEVGLVLTESK